MTAKSMRSFAGGLIVAAGVCGAVYFFGPGETTSSQTADQPSVAEMKSLLTSEGYTSIQKKSGMSRWQLLTKRKLRQQQKRKKNTTKNCLSYDYNCI